MDSGTTLIVLVLLLVILVLALVYLYKWLNRSTDNEYTLQQLLNGKGGVRGRVREAVRVVEGRLGLHLWPRKTEEDGEDEENQVEESKGAPQSEQGNEGDANSLVGKGNGEEEDSSDDYSSMEGMNVSEGVRLVNGREEEEKKNGGRKEESSEDGEAEAAAGGGLVADLQFSGSAIWGEEKAEGKTGNCDTTAL